MQKTVFSLSIFLLFVLTAFAQDVTGTWKTVDDRNGKAKSHVEIYKKDGKVYGKIVKIINPKSQGNLCEDCEGEDKGKPILGLVIIKGLTKDGTEYNGGKILDPGIGKSYKCYIELEEENKLKVRGYIGISLIGRTQYWYRVQ